MLAACLIESREGQNGVSDLSTEIVLFEACFQHSEGDRIVPVSERSSSIP